MAVLKRKSFTRQEFKNKARNVFYKFFRPARYIDYTASNFEQDALKKVVKFPFTSLAEKPEILNKTPLGIAIRAAILDVAIRTIHTIYKLEGADPLKKLGGEKSEPIKKVLIEALKKTWEDVMLVSKSAAEFVWSERGLKIAAALYLAGKTVGYLRRLQHKVDTPKEFMLFIAEKILWATVLVNLREIKYVMDESVVPVLNKNKYLGVRETVVSTMIVSPIIIGLAIKIMRKRLIKKRMLEAFSPRKILPLAPPKELEAIGDADEDVKRMAEEMLKDFKPGTTN